MSIKHYALSEEERRELFSILESALQRKPQRIGVRRISHYRDMFSNEHPVVEEVIGRDRIRHHLVTCGFAGRQIEALMSFTWGMATPHFSRILERLNDELVVMNLLRVPNVGRLTVRSTLVLVLEKGWVHHADALAAINAWLKETQNG